MSQPIEAGMPVNLDLEAGYVIRVTAIDPSSGALVSGVNVSTTVLTAGQGSLVLSGGGGTAGEWLLVPGPGA